MSTETAVLCALLRLARRRGPATMNDLLARVAARPRDIRRALAALARADLVTITPGRAAPRLSLAGLAVAAASAAVRFEAAEVRRAARARTVARVVPFVRRRPAA